MLTLQAVPPWGEIHPASAGADCHPNCSAVCSAQPSAKRFRAITAAARCGAAHGGAQCGPDRCQPAHCGVLVPVR